MAPKSTNLCYPLVPAFDHFSLADLKNVLDFFQKRIKINRELEWLSSVAGTVNLLAILESQHIVTGHFLAFARIGRFCSKKIHT